MSQKARTSRSKSVRGLVVCGMILYGISGPPAVAVDGGMAHYAILAKHNEKPPLPWITQLRLSKNTGAIRLADGAIMLNRPGIVRSAYDSSVQHDVSKFYRPDKMHVNAMMHYAGRRAGEVFSFGFDSGFSATKMKVKPALFFGYARAFEVTKTTAVSMSAGGWLGGKVSEKPCLDAYDREYYCPTLTAWTDYRPPRRRLHQYINLMFVHNF